MNKNIIENAFIENLVKTFRRSPVQLNDLQGSDAELIQMPGSNTILAITTDALLEEIETGMYNDPYLIGWMAIMINLSDLAAVGAEPLGLVINETLKPDLNQTYIQRLQLGISDACSACNTYVLGGDTNFSNKIMIGGTAIGISSKKNLLTRIGCKPNDILYSTGKLGLGNAYAFQQLLQNSSNATPDPSNIFDLSNNPTPSNNPAPSNNLTPSINAAHSNNPNSSNNPTKLNNIDYKPVARIKDGLLIRDYASACMDTSDGFFATVDQLTRLNNVGFQIEVQPNELISPQAINICHAFNFSPYLMLSGIHGEFELIFTVPQSEEYNLLKLFENQQSQPIRIGKVIEEKKITVLVHGENREVDTTSIRNCYSEFSNNITAYFNRLKSFFINP